MHTTQCQPTFGHSARSVLGSPTSGAARLGGAVRRTARPGDGSRSWRMTSSPGPASFIRGPKSASPSNTRGGSRVPEWGPLGSVRGALSNERPYRDLRNVAANYPFERAHRFAGIQPNSGDRDYSRLSCAAGEMPLGSRVAGIFSKRVMRDVWPSSGTAVRHAPAANDLPPHGLVPPYRQEALDGIGEKRIPYPRPN